MNRALILNLIIVLITSCRSPVQPQERTLLNINALISKSFDHYRKEPPAQMIKTLRYEDKLDQKHFDTTEFGKIDTLFREVNIHKSAYLNSYYITDRPLQKSINSNLHHLSYRIKEDETAPVKRLDYFYEGKAGEEKPVALLILKKDFNKLYKSTQIIRATFEEGWLEQLEIAGTENILFREPTAYDLLYQF
ncbi:MAG: hypothetical protein WD077_06185 [Bacteroidia bacterium]